MKRNTYRVALASQSALKKQVVEQLLVELADQIKCPVELTCVQVLDVDQVAQPINEGGLAMARNRVRYVLEHGTDRYDAILVLENYIHSYHPTHHLYLVSRPMDLGLAMIYLPHEGTEFWGLSTGVPLPDLALWAEMLEGYVEIPAGLEKTYGQRYHELHPEVPADHWMKDLCGMDRVELLKGALRVQFDKVKQAMHFIKRLMTGFKVYADFPKPGVDFLDWFNIFLDPFLVQDLVQHLAHKYSDRSRFPAIDYVAGLESRGYLLALPLAMALDASFIPIRKAGKLPPPKVSRSYEKEYGTDTLEMSAALPPGNLILADDILATGGSMLAAIQLAEEAHHRIIDCIVIRDVPSLRESATMKLKGYPIRCLIQESVDKAKS
jgi:adenine phosphoribosyltransferase